MAPGVGKTAGGEGGRDKPTTPKGPAFLYGGGVFGGSLTLCLVVLTSLGVL